MASDYRTQPPFPLFKAATEYRQDYGIRLSVLQRKCQAIMQKASGRLTNHGQGMPKGAQDADRASEIQRTIARESARERATENSPWHVTQRQSMTKCWFFIRPSGWSLPCHQENEIYDKRLLTLSPGPKRTKQRQQTTKEESNSKALTKIHIRLPKKKKKQNASC